MSRRAGPAGCTVDWQAPAHVVSWPPAEPSLTESHIYLSFPGPSVWSVELITPVGSLTDQITVIPDV